jgi:sugar/nucleoside kinase (ribokinase family)
MDHLHISGYAFLSAAQRPAACKAIRIAANRGMTISCDPPPANLILALGVARFLSELASVGWLFPNLSEGRVLTGLDDPDEIAARLAEDFDAGALTLAADGALAWFASRFDRRAAKPLHDVDPTGAGDAYAAAFVCSLLAGAPLGTANERACAAAAAHLRAKEQPSASP